MVMVAVVALPAKFCNACNGTGHVARLVNGRFQNSGSQCADCAGTGDVPADYFLMTGTSAVIERFVDSLMAEGV
jgi:hypothetical protein